jgi:hypothetical protein
MAIPDAGAIPASTPAAPPAASTRSPAVRSTRRTREATVASGNAPKHAAYARAALGAALSTRHAVAPRPKQTGFALQYM